MPRVPKRQKRQRPADALAELHPELRRALEKGRGFFEEFETKEDMQESWELVGEELLAEWIVNHPGTRPYAWWVFTHKKERPVLNPENQEMADQWRERERFGFLHSEIYGGPQMCPIQEPQTSYLERLGLLSADELSRVEFEEEYPDDMDAGVRISKIMCRGPRRQKPGK